MTPSEPAAIFDAVLGGRRQRRGPGRLPVHGAAWVVAVAAHFGLWYAASGTEPSLEVWSARMAALIHEELNNEAPIAVETPPAPKPKPKPVRKSKPKIQRTASPKPTPPAAAAQVIAVDPQPTAPVDFTDTTFIVGNSKTYVGGITSSEGKGKKPSMERPSLARPVQLSGNEWRCSWPMSAVNEDIYEQFVVLRVTVAADGEVENAQVVKDPGHGFGDAAVACALRTRFTPALDANGNPIRAASPAIRVRFTR